ncbi:hypothetical protein XNC3_2150019 [Xenorhabdus nematophila F1]|nr:hypothetical protein XNC3_2150019 [Xenorhabdus nematophila F1]
MDCCFCREDCFFHEDYFCREDCFFHEDYFCRKDYFCHEDHSFVETIPAVEKVCH